MKKIVTIIIVSFFIFGLTFNVFAQTNNDVQAKPKITFPFIKKSEVKQEIKEIKKDAKAKIKTIKQDAKQDVKNLKGQEKVQVESKGVSALRAKMTEEIKILERKFKEEKRKIIEKYNVLVKQLKAKEGNTNTEIQKSVPILPSTTQ